MTHTMTVNTQQNAAESSSKSTASPDGAYRLTAHLSQFGREDMVQLIHELASLYPDVKTSVLERHPKFANIYSQEIVHRIRQHFRRLAKGECTPDDVDQDGTAPNVDTLNRQLTELANTGQRDAILQLGEILVRQGGLIVKHFTDTTATLKALRSCLEPALTHLPASSLTPAMQLSWLIDILLEDDAQLIHNDDIDALLIHTHYTREHWRMVSELLEVRLAQRVSVTVGSKERRRKILALLTDVYKRSGGSDKIVPLLTRELNYSQCYLLLVNALLDQGDANGARSWCIAGYRSLLKKSPEIAKSLRDRWCELTLVDGKAHKVAACRAQAFFEYPTLEHYQSLKEATQRARCWPAVRLATLEYLETGHRPDERYAPTSKQWPLPVSDFKSTRPILKNNPLAQFPAWTKLIDIALLEGRMDEIASLYRRMEPLGQFGGVQNKMAEALADSHPELAIEIQFSMARHRLTETRPQPRDGNYREAINHLTRAFDIGWDHKLDSAWLHQVDNLLAEFAYRPKLHGMLISFFRRTQSVMDRGHLKAALDESREASVRPNRATAIQVPNTFRWNPWLKPEDTQA